MSIKYGYICIYIIIIKILQYYATGLIHMLIFIIIGHITNIFSFLFLVFFFNVVKQYLQNCLITSRILCMKCAQATMLTNFVRKVDQSKMTITTYTIKDVTCRVISE